MRLQRRVHELRDVSAGVREGHHRVLVAHQLQRDVLILVGDRLEEEGVEVALEGDVDHGLYRIAAALACHLGHRAVRTVDVVHYEEPVEHGRARLGPEGLAVELRPRRLDQLGAQALVAQARTLLGQRQLADLAPHRQLVERRLRLERENRRQRAAVHLGEHATAGRRRLVDQAHVLAPDPGRVLAPEQTEGNRPACLDRELTQAAMIIAPRLLAAAGAVDAFTGDLEDSGVEVAHHADESTHLVPARHAAGDGAAIRRFVARRARGREAHSAGLDGVAQLRLHGAEVVLGGAGVEGALAHHVGAQRRVTEIAGVVDALRQTLERVEELAVRRPRPFDSGVHRLGGDIFRALEIADDEVLVLGRARRQCEPAISHDDAGDPVPARARAVRVPEDLRVHVGVPVDEPRSDHLAVRVDHFTRALPDAADADDATTTDADIGAEAG